MSTYNSFESTSNSNSENRTTDKHDVATIQSNAADDDDVVSSSTWFHRANASAMLLIAVSVIVFLAVSIEPNATLFSRSSNSNKLSISTSSSMPNIVFILTDDQGMGDMDITGGDFESLMPNIRKLNEAGLNITHYYSASLCTPARSALMTGRYPVNTGMQHGVVMATQPWGLPLSEKLLSEYFQEIGYSTYHIGKWHLGHYSKSHLPTARGFDSSMGFYGGYQHPKSYFYEWPGCSNSSGCLPDMHRNNEVYDVDGQFNIDTFGDETESVISKHSLENSGVPLFLYLAPPLIHMPVHPDETVMSENSEALSSLSNIWRRRMGGMAIMLDTFVKRVYTSLDNNGLMDNSVIIFASDNGAQAEGSQMGAGSNFPLRGSKGSLYEGATRVPAFVYSPLLGHSLDKKGTNYDHLTHVTDWLPTIMDGIIGRGDVLSDDIDGVNHWDWMKGDADDSEPPRNSIVYNIDTVTGISAIRVGKWKLLLNESSDVGWYDGDTFGLDFCASTATNSVQLYDLESDEEERYDLSMQQPEVVAELRSSIDQYISSAKYPAYCGVDDDRGIDKWFECNEIEPWLNLTSSSEDYDCPDTFKFSTGWCTMVDASTALPMPPAGVSLPGGGPKLGKNHDN